MAVTQTRREKGNFWTYSTIMSARKKPGFSLLPPGKSDSFFFLQQQQEPKSAVADECCPYAKPRMNLMVTQLLHEGWEPQLYSNDSSESLPEMFLFKSSHSRWCYPDGIFLSGNVPGEGTGFEISLLGE